MGKEDDGVKTLLLIMKFIRIGVGLWLVAIINSFILSLFDNSKIGYGIYKVCIYAVTGVMTALLVVNLFTQIFYFVDENNFYQACPAFFAVYLIAGLVLAADSILFLLNSKRFSKQVNLIFYICLSLIVVATALQFVFPKFAFYDIMVAASVAFLLVCAQAQMRRTLAERDEKLSRQRTKLLQRQVSPHFIYNALTAIQALPNNPYETKKAIGDFAKYLRHTLSATNQNELVPFEKELENVQAYFHLEKIRFVDGLHIDYDVKEKDFDIPIMCVHILSENAVKHGVSLKSKGGTVRISSKRQGDFIVITVKDDGVGFDTVKAFDDSHVGIKNVQSRIRSLVNGELIIESEIGVGTKATIRIPLIRDKSKNGINL